VRSGVTVVLGGTPYSAMLLKDVVPDGKGNRRKKRGVEFGKQETGKQETGSTGIWSAGAGGGGGGGGGERELLCV
jgi:hypothetical protein